MILISVKLNIHFGNRGPLFSKLCGKCEAVCSRNALNVNPISKTWTLNNRLCNQCLACVVTCPARSLTQVKL